VDEERLHVKFVTPTRLVYEGEGDIVEAPGDVGDFSIHPGHTKFLARLRPGLLRITKDEESLAFAVSGGYLEAVDNRVTIIARTAESGEEIDVERALSAKTRAQKRMESKDPDVDYHRARLAYERALARLKVVEEKERRG